MENNNREASVEDVVNYMAALDRTKSSTSIKRKSSSSTEISQPFVERPIRASPNHVNSNEDYQHIRNCLNCLTKKVSQLAASVKPIVFAWNEHNSTDSDEVIGSIDLISSCLETLYTNTS